jgi:hypothetical protein
MIMRHVVRLLPLLPLLAVSVAAQGLYTGTTAGAGLITRGFFFQPGLRARTVSQVAIPIAVAMPISRALSVDVSTQWAWTRLTTYDGAEESLSGLTDTEVRATYALGRDRAILTLSANLPTGQTGLDPSRLAVVGAVGSNFLPFPVSSYGSATSVTIGGAAAHRVGGVNVGFGLSARVSGSWEPFESLPLALTPGVETRAQLAGDAIVGRGRVSAGLMFSTFGADAFAGTTADVGVSQAYQSGNRVVAEVAVAYPVGPGMLNVGLWDFMRGDAEADEAVVTGSKENILGLGGSWQVGAAPGIAITPGLEMRQWSRNGGTAGRLVTAGLSLDVALGQRASLLPQARTDWGFVNNAFGTTVPVQGWTVGMLAQWDF